MKSDFRLVIQQKGDDLQAIESYGTELVNNAESKIVKLENELQAKESIISDLQNGGRSGLSVCLSA